MDNLIIFGAKYLWIVSVLLAIFFFLRSGRKGEVLKFSAWALPITYILGVMARLLYENPRPFVAENFTPLIEHAADNGFPSDHALLVASIAGIVTIFDRRMGVSLWIIALLVATSRVLAGVHHFADVLASIVISVAVVAMVYFVNNQKRNATRNNPSEQ